MSSHEIELFQKGLKLFDKQQWVEALSCFEEANQTAPKFAPAHFYSAFSHLALEHLEEARIFTESGLRQSPNNPLGLNLSALLAFRENKIENAYALLKTHSICEHPRIQAFFLLEFEKLLAAQR